jgi:hypothetical protein
LQQPRIAAHRTLGAETAHDLVLVVSRLSGHLAQAASIPEPRRTRRGALLVSPYLRRRKLIIRSFGTEGQHRSVGLFLHNKTHTTRAASTFPLDHHCKVSPGAEAVHEPKPTARPDVVNSFRRPFSPTLLLLLSCALQRSNPSPKEEERKVTDGRWAGRPAAMAPPAGWWRTSGGQGKRRW